MAHALPRLFKILEESSFVQTGIDWAASGSLGYVIDPDVSQLGQAVVPNENIRPRVLAVHQNIHTLKRGEASFGMYMHGSSASAAEGAAATVTAFAHLDIVLKNYFGLRKLGYGIGYASGSASQPVVDADTNVDITDFHFAVDDTTGEGQFYRVLAQPGGNELTYDRDLHFTPAAADRAYSVVSYVFDQTAITDHTDSDHETAAMVVVGEHANDVFECLGCKFSIEIEPINPGEPTKLAVSALVTTHDLIAKPTLSGTPLGDPGAVPSMSNDTLLLMSDAGGNMAAQVARGTITVSLGVKYERVEGVPGTEGVLGHVATGFGETTVELMVPYDDQWIDDFEAGTEKQMLLQFGSTVASQPWGLYFPQLEIAESPTRVDQGGLTSMRLMLRARENQASPGALSGDDLKAHYSPVALLVKA